MKNDDMVKSERGIYYCRYSSPPTEEDTNLQLYSLRKAGSEWNDLVELKSKLGINHVDALKERLIFILNCLGLSLSQLLGQNSPSPEKDHMDSMGIQLSNIIRHRNLDQDRDQKLKLTFQDFLRYYNSGRHFGINKNEQNYRTVDNLTFQELKRFVSMTLEIWTVIISDMKENNENDLAALDSVNDLVHFKDIDE